MKCLKVGMQIDFLVKLAVNLAISKFTLIIFVSSSLITYSSKRGYWKQPQYDHTCVNPLIHSQYVDCTRRFSSSIFQNHALS